MNDLERSPSMPGVFDLWAPRLLVFLTFAVPLIFCLDMADTFDLPKMSCVYVVDLILAALWARQGLTESVLRIRRTPLDLPLVAFLAAAGISTVFSIDPRLSLLGTYKIYVFGWVPLLSFSALYWFTTQAASEELRGRVQRAAVLSAVCVGLYGLLQYSGLEIFQRMPNAKGARVWSSLGNPLYMGALCMMAFPVIMTRLADAEGRPRWSGLAALIPVTGGLILSLSRSAWLGALASFVCLWMVGGNTKQRNWMGGVLVIGVIGMMFVPGVRERVSGMLSTRESSNAARVAGWKAGLHVWRAHPWIGSGTDTFLQAFRPHRSLEFVRAAGTAVTQADAHNDFIQIAATQGGLGLAAFAGLLMAFFRSIRTTLSDPARRGLAAGLVGLFVQNQFNFSAAATSAWVAVFAGLAVHKMVNQEWRTPAMRGVLWMLLAVCPAGAWATFIPVRADAAYHAGLGWAQTGQVLKALYAFEQAVDLQGRVDVYKTELANLLRTLATVSSGGPAREKYLDRAWEMADSAVRDHPHHPDVWNNRGVAAMWMIQLAQRNLQQEARQSFERAVSLDPVFVDAWANLAKWEHLAGHLDNEKELWWKVLEIDPLHPMALQVLGEKK